MKRDIVDNLELLVISYAQVEQILAQIQLYLREAIKNEDDKVIREQIDAVYQSSIILAGTLNLDVVSQFAAAMTYVLSDVDHVALKKLADRGSMNTVERIRDLQERLLTEDEDGHDQGSSDDPDQSGGGSTGSGSGTLLN